MIFKKKYSFFIISGAILILIVVPLFFKIFFYINFNEGLLRKTASEFCKEYLDKAVKFDDIYIDYSGNLLLSNLDLSNSSDFNDSMSLLKSDKIVIHLNFFELLKKNIKILDIIFKNSIITIHKQYGKEHYDSLKNLLIFKKDFKDIKYADFKNFSLSFLNSEIHYTEIFKEKKLTVGCANVNGNFKFADDKIIYDIHGKLIPHKLKAIKKGVFQLSGHFFSNNKNSVHNVEIENFDLAYINEFFSEYRIITNSIKGGLSLNLKSAVDNQITTVKGTVETHNFDYTSVAPSPYKIISNKTMSLDLDLEINNKDNIYNLSRLTLFDDNLSLEGFGKYISNKKDESLIFSFKSNHMDLSRLSDFFTPVKDFTYNGKLQLNAEADIDIKNKKVNNISAGINLENFNVEWFNKGKKDKVFTDTKFKLNADTKGVSCNGLIRLFHSDFLLNSNTTVKEWHPIKSETAALINSKVVEIDLLFSALKGSLNYIFSRAYEDSKRGYDHVNFLELPVAKTISNNDIQLRLEGNKVRFEGNANLEGLFMELSLKNGQVSIKDFKVSGYDGKYSAELFIFLNRDYPFFTSRGSVKNFNLKEISKDLGGTYALTGTASCEYEFDLNAYRPSQMLEHSEALLNISITSGSIKNTNIQKRLYKYFEQNGLHTSDFTDLNFQNFSVTMTQRGGNFFISNFSLNSEPVNFNSYGLYNYADGISVYIYPIITDRENKIMNIPFRISGPLVNPEISLINRKDVKKHQLFQID